MRNLAAWLALFTLLAPLAAQAEITKREARTQPAGRTQRQVLSQVGDILVRQPVKPGPEPTQPLTDYWMQTRPHATSYPGLCRTDTLIAEFEPTGGQGEGADQPVKVSGFSSFSYFQVIGEVAAEPDYAPAARARRTGDCRNRTGAATADFAADNERDAWQGYRLWTRLPPLVGKPDLDLTCSLFESDKDKACAAVLDAFAPKDLSRVEACDDPEAGVRCTDLTLGWRGDTSVRVRWRDLGGEPQIISAHLTQTLVLIEERRD